ncbi:DUF817 domain-containing protein [Phaeobacter sp. HF9A]|uniref:DUF817 domain-containing protein n=1 Tax=Phaeobacter sp. HF9A TaxID=2721561 RepID=UPI0014311599|nr:DUF817 domain-containing protein [Phaeobacter sp. HF9A]NIZ14034.1 DUF817 domain-containing protein [Phaeobacter sp. HF9A]
MRARLPFAVAEFVMFTLKQGWAAIFGILLLGGLLLSNHIWQADWPIARYDALLLYALALQVLFLATGMESWREVRVILLFHLTGTVMEIFKVDAGSWAYPGAGVMKLLGVPLFSGFMYASVGSYMARVIRLFEMRFAPYPPTWMAIGLALAIYVNFFSHHFLPDARLLLFVATVLIFIRTRIWFFIGGQAYWMPLPLAAFLSSFFLWVAENVGTSTRTWLYAGQDHGSWVSLAKMGSWYLLLYVSFVTVTLVVRDALSHRPYHPSRQTLRQSPASAGPEPKAQ